MTFHVDLILACTTCLGRPGALYPRPSFLLRPAVESLQRSRTYVCGTNILGRTACEHATAVGPIRFNSAALSLLLSPFLFRSPASFFSVSRYLRPARSTYSLENDRSSVDFTRGGFSPPAFVPSLFLFLFSLSLSPFFFFFLAFMQPDEGSRSSGIQFHLLTNYH